eukprot:9649952-Karenia_brevis.AAC.1
MGYKWTVLVGKGRTTGMIMATTVPRKGGRGAYKRERREVKTVVVERAIQEIEGRIRAILLSLEERLSRD